MDSAPSAPIGRLLSLLIMAIRATKETITQTFVSQIALRDVVRSVVGVVVCSHAYHQHHLFSRLRTHKVRSLTSQGAISPAVSTRGQGRPLALRNNVATSEHTSQTETTCEARIRQMNRKDRCARWFACTSLDSLAIPRQIIPKRGHRHRSPHTRDL